MNSCLKGRRGRDFPQNCHNNYYTFLIATSRSAIVRFYSLSVVQQKPPVSLHSGLWQRHQHTLFELKSVLFDMGRRGRCRVFRF